MDSTSSPETAPYVFDDFFASGKEESISPFLTTSSRSLGKNLHLKASIFAAFCLLAAFILSFFPSLAPIVSLLLVVTYFTAGMPALIDSIKDVFSLEINIDVLMTLAAFLSILIGSAMEGALLLVLFALSGAMEHAVTRKAQGSLSRLNQLCPTKAQVIDDDGKTKMRAVRDIKRGDTILVRSGEIVPLDGRVISGASSVNLVHLTGESLPVPKKIDDEVSAGAHNMEGVLTLKVTRGSTESTISRIVKLISQAQEARPKLQRWFDRFSKVYATSIIAIAFLLALLLPLIISISFLGTEGSVYRALAFLIAASPCALIIAVPIAYLSAISACARTGILLKGGVIFDALASCSTIAFDKTGTLTTGGLTLTGIIGEEQLTSVERDRLLSIAYSLERNTIHPIASAIVHYCEQRCIELLPVKEFKTIPGSGASGVVLVDGKEIHTFIGHPDYVLDKLEGSRRENLTKEIDVVRNNGELVALLYEESRVYLMRFKDEIRPHVSATVHALKKRWHYKTLMLSGDHATTAHAIANELGIEEVYADLKPEDKLQHVTRLAEQGKLAMIGDGINDAPALARATVGISMGGVGDTTTTDISDIVLLHDNIELLDWLVAKAKMVQTIVKENVAFAGAIICFISIAALLGYIPLWLAVILHEGGTVLVGLNSLRLLKSFKQKG
ncbi:cation-translocating P-type ATPase [Simkania negevensis]|uniref:Cation-translocating P-type ATPase n=1 Tax=Simkania negevensis TaxID=83561 RepID=A0ABS3APL2_9BACT|nr:cation-translocating P-type ATPase [Simkania negevensis]